MMKKHEAIVCKRAEEMMNTAFAFYLDQFSSCEQDVLEMYSTRVVGALCRTFVASQETVLCTINKLKSTSMH